MATGPITAQDLQRMGPVRRFLAGRPRLVDAIVVVLFVGAVLTSTLDPAQRLAVPGAVVMAAVGGTALAFRRSHPEAVTAVMLAVAGVSLPRLGQLGGAELGLGFALYAVAVSRPPRTAWLAAAVVTAVTATAVWLWEQRTVDPVEPGDADVLSDDRLGTLAGLLVMVLFAMAVGVSVRNRREHVADQLARAEALDRDRDRLAQLARAAERTRIAREMHDVVAHSLSVMVTLADGATSTLDRAPERTRRALGEMSATGRAALRDMRRVLGALGEDGAPLEPTGPGEDLTTLVERFRTAGLVVRTDGAQLPTTGDTGLRLAVFRVVQESLTNVLRHAPGTPQVDLTVRPGPTHWEVEVVDQGAVLPAADAGGAGLGLVGMRERVEVLGGTVQAGPWGRGWRVHVQIPTQEERR